MKSSSTKPGWLGCAAIAAVVGLVIFHAGKSRTTRPVVRVLYRLDGRALPFLVAREKGFFGAQRIDVQMTSWRPTLAEPRADWARMLKDLSAGEHDMVAGCPARVIFEAVQKSPTEWVWLGAGMEFHGGDALCVVLAKRNSGIASLDDLAQRLKSGTAGMVVADQHWSEEAKRVWRLPDNACTEVVQPFAADPFAKHTAVAAFGDAMDMAAFRDDPRFLPLESNVRALLLHDPYWDSAHLVRRSFAEKHPEVLIALAEALEEAQRLVKANPGDIRTICQSSFGSSLFSGKNLGIPAYLSVGDSWDAIVSWGRMNPRTDMTLLKETAWRRRSKTASGDLEPEPLESSEEDLPPFSAPKSKDVQAISRP